MNCRVCGSQLSPAARSCIECGSAVLLTRAAEGDAAATTRLELRAEDDDAPVAEADEQPIETADEAPIGSPPPIQSRPARVSRASKSRPSNVTALPKRATAHTAGAAALLSLDPVPEATPIPDVEPGQTSRGRSPEPALPEPQQAAFVPPALPEPTPTTLADGVDQTRIVVRAPRARFRLTFSNGEDHQVVGHSILGRRPTPQPGDESPRLITVSDPERSVSKTHLELGIENGTLWISDRWSSNGTVLVTPHGVGRICDPGRRYEVEAGSTVEIGDVTFIVSTL
ncbi:FHA domain-containing protein (plasmid) [Streptomyces sp. L7]|uniref:FHA domain-containing protein n=1 Tax=Streptomyces sp. L7 TaxID=3423954 RepID=UPI00389A6D51